LLTFSAVLCYILIVGVLSGIHGLLMVGAALEQTFMLTEMTGYCAKAAFLYAGKNSLAKGFDL